MYQSSGPARRATLLKQLTLHNMADGEDAHEHLQKFFNTVDKLSEMEVEINPDLLTVMILYSLPPSFENFRCAIEPRSSRNQTRGKRTRTNQTRCTRGNIRQLGKIEDERLTARKEMVRKAKMSRDTRNSSIVVIVARKLVIRQPIVTNRRATPKVRQIQSTTWACA